MDSNSFLPYIYFLYIKEHFTPGPPHEIISFEITAAPPLFCHTRARKGLFSNRKQWLFLIRVSKLYNFKLNLYTNRAPRDSCFRSMLLSTYEPNVLNSFRVGSLI
jgi:hypothetical protein